MYKKYLFYIFLKKIFLVSLIFSLLIFIISLFEEVSFFKNNSLGFLIAIQATLLNLPSVIYQLFPFIFLISTQSFFIELIDKNELEIFKMNGLKNISLVNFLLINSFLFSIVVILVFYNFSAKTQNVYLKIKSSYSSDGKYLAVINNNGLWIKDVFNSQVNIINAKKIEGDYLLNASINSFSSDFVPIEIIEAKKINISDKQWKMTNYNRLLLDNENLLDNKNMIKDDNRSNIIETNFDIQLINNLFKNFDSFTIMKLLDLKQNNNFNFTNDEINLQLYKVLSYPIYLSLMTLLSSIVMLNIKRNMPKIIYMITGIGLSVIIYFFNILFQSLGKNGTISIEISLIMPILILSLFCASSLIQINEK